MLPFDRRPWAKPVAAIVISMSFMGAIALAYYFYDNDSLHISEVVGIVLLLLTIVPPNIAIVLRKSDAEEGINTHLRHTRSTVR